MANMEQLLAELNAKRDEAKKLVEEAEKAYKLAKDEERRIAREKANIEHEEFKARLGRENGVTKNPKFDRCFEIAWEQGHSEGYQAVEWRFEELVELIK